MKEEFVSFEQAVALKECGFDWECDRYYAPYGDLWNLDKPMGQSQSNTYSLAPTLALAQKWLREVKKVIVLVCHDFVDEDTPVYAFKIARYIPEGKGRCKCALDFLESTYLLQVSSSYSGDYPTCESALSAGLDAALELIKQK